MNTKPKQWPPPDEFEKQQSRAARWRPWALIVAGLLMAALIAVVASEIARWLLSN